MKEVAYRNEQFEKIAKLREEYATAGNPVMSVDTKKKENIGNFYRDGLLYTTDEVQTYDHDFKSSADGVVIPHAIYDVQQNKGFINIGTSRDTSQFACDSIRNWWLQQGIFDYPSATSILLLCDGGGSNSSSAYIFKQELQALVNDIGIEIRIAHYPPYCSKYNPVEHRLFSHVTRACQGVIFKSVDVVRQLIAQTSTETGLTVTVDVLDHVYEVGRKAAADFKDNMTFIFDPLLPKWNYTATPQLLSNTQVI
jgi:hypothetical protein